MTDKELRKATEEFYDAIASGNVATGLCTVRDAVTRMFEMKSDVMEMYFIRDGKRWNVELRILRAEDVV